MILSVQMTRMNKWVWAGFSVFALLTMNACVSKNEFLNSSVVPAARGYVKVTKDDNQNYKIHLDVNYLAESTRLNPPRNTYVVWMETNQDQAKNIGQINNNKHSASNNMKASFDTVSSTEPSRIFITAEDDAATSYPGSAVILTTGKIKN